MISADALTAADDPAPRSGERRELARTVAASLRDACERREEQALDDRWRRGNSRVTMSR
jgi:hypothetical protein